MERYALDFFGLQGGGLYIQGTATLTNTNVYDNQASGVCSPSKVSLNYDPVPRWNVSVLMVGSLAGDFTPWARQR